MSHFIDAIRAAVDALPESTAAKLRDGLLHAPARTGPVDVLLFRADAAAEPQRVTLDQGGTPARTRLEPDKLMDGITRALLRLLDPAECPRLRRMEERLSAEKLPLALLVSSEVDLGDDEAGLRELFGFRPKACAYHLGDQWNE
jgi:hypothetical protein